MRERGRGTKVFGAAPVRSRFQVVDDPDAVLALMDDGAQGIVAAMRTAQAQHYRAVTAMSRDEKIRCGASVYVSFLRPFAREAGVEDRLDWTVLRDLPEFVCQLVSAIEGDNQGVADDGPSYSPLP